MTATPTPLRDTIGHMRDIADVAERYTVEELRDVLREKADELEATLSARDAAGAVDWTRPIETVRGESARLAFPLDPAGADVLVHVEIGCGRWAYNLDGTPIQSNGHMPRIRNVATPPAASGDAEVLRYLRAMRYEAQQAPGKAALVSVEAFDDLIRRLAAVAPAPRPDIEAMEWPADGRFQVIDEPEEHAPCYLVMPGGEALPFAHHAKNGVDQARAIFIADTCNAALAAVAPAGMDGWIPVSERLPEEYGWYHCAVEGVGDLGMARWQEIVSLGHYADYGKRFSTFGGVRVTHWKPLGPLPTPPATAGKE